MLICEAARHVVTVASNGLEALTVLEASPFDLVLTDVVMPKMDGIALTAAIRRSGGDNAHIPIIGMTALAGRDSLREMLNAGMDEVVTKPFRNRELLAVLTRALAQGSGPVTFSPAAQAWQGESLH